MSDQKEKFELVGRGSGKLIQHSRCRTVQNTAYLMQTPDEDTHWESPESDSIVSALRLFFISHTLDPLTGEVHTVH